MRRLSGGYGICNVLMYIDESNDCTIVSFTRDWCVSKSIKSEDPCQAENGRGLPAQVLGQRTNKDVERSELKFPKVCLLPGSPLL